VRNVTVVEMSTLPRTGGAIRELESAFAVCIILLATIVTCANVVSMEMLRIKLANVSNLTSFLTVFILTYPAFSEGGNPNHDFWQSVD
jgi:hypothetical protein